MLTKYKKGGVKVIVFLDEPYWKGVKLALLIVLRGSTLLSC
ncbi:hypothetical protein [Saccharolobus sp.]